MNTGEWLIGLESTPPVCSGQAPPCLPAPLPSIPVQPVHQGHRRARLDPEADHRQLGTARRRGVAAQRRRWCCAAATRCCGIRWCRAASTASTSTRSWGWPQFSGIDTGDDEHRVRARFSASKHSEPAVPGAARRRRGTAKGFYNDPNRKNAYSHQWHVDLQREITRKLMVGVAYVGSYNGRMEYAGRPQAPRQAAVDATGRRLTAAERDALRPWPHMNGTFTYSDDIGMSKYNSLQFKAQQRFVERRVEPVLLHLVAIDRHQQRLVQCRRRHRRRRHGAELSRHRRQQGDLELRRAAHRHLGGDLGAAVRRRASAGCKTAPHRRSSAAGS